MKPAMVFIVDVRRGNLQLHLMYKALFELSKDRAEFVSRLFAKKRPGGLTATVDALEIFNAYAEVPTSEALLQGEPQGDPGSPREDARPAARRRGPQGHRVRRPQFYWFGPGITYSSQPAGAAGARCRPTPT